MRGADHDLPADTPWGGGAVGGAVIARERSGQWDVSHEVPPVRDQGLDVRAEVRALLGRAGVDVSVVLDEAVSHALGDDLTNRSPTELRAFARDVTRQVARLEGLRGRIAGAAESSGAVDVDGASSSAVWLADATGGTPRAASSTVALGRAMKQVPTLADAVSAGRVGAEHAGAIARAADRGVLDTAQLDSLVAEATALPAGVFTRHVRAEEARTGQSRLRRDERYARDRRRADWGWTDDGHFFEGSFRLPRLDGAVVETALNALTLPDAADTPDDARRTPTHRRADAVSQLGRLTLERGETSLVRSVKPHVTVTVPVAMFEPGTDEAPDAAAEAAGAVGTLPDGTLLSAAATRRLLCDAAVRRLVLDPAGEPLDVGRATRTWSGAQRAAVAAVDGGCRGPGCDRPFGWTDIHHIRWWRRQGRTSITNGIALCGRCHDLVHHNGWNLSMDPASREANWTSPTGRTVVTRPRGPAAAVHRR